MPSALQSFLVFWLGDWKNIQAEIQTWSLFALYVCVLQPQADLNQNSSMGRIRFLDSDEKAGQKLFSLAGHTGWTPKGNPERDALAVWRIIPDTPGGVRRAASENHRVGSCFVNPQKDEKSRDIRLISYNCRLHFSSKKAGLYGILLVEKKSRENTRWSRFLQKIS